MSEPLPQDSIPRNFCYATLDIIQGVSAFNPRAEAAGNIRECYPEPIDGIESLAASILASGQLQPLLVTVENGSHVVLDGWRRWRAMLHLVNQDIWAPDHPIEIEVLEGSETSLREIALAANTMHRPLHPVEEFKAFAAMEQAGFDEERIAKDFGLGLRHVRQRLALGRLAPKILDAWFEGKLDADKARAFTAGETHAAQEAVYDKLNQGAAPISTYEIKKMLRSASLSGDSQEALYVGAEAYLAAGGRIHDDLFEDGTIFCDGPLLELLVREKLLAKGEEIAEREGWGFVVLDEECKSPSYFKTGEALPFLTSETARLDEIDAEEEKIDNNGTDEELLDKLEKEREEIEARATLRSISKAQRSELGLVVGLNEDGLARIARGLIAEKPPTANDLSLSSPSPRAGKKKDAASSSPSPTPSKPDDSSKALREVLNAAISQTFSDCVSSRPDLALVIAVAKLGTSYGSPGEVIDFDKGMADSPIKIKSELLARIKTLRFDEALTICAAAPLCDLTTAFTELVARSISVSIATSLSDLDPLAETLAARGAPLGQAFDRALDRPAYFDAAAKQACIDALDSMGATPLRSAKKSALASFAAETAREKHWLPKPLSTWAELPATSPERPHDDEESQPLAEAMDEAIADDEVAKKDNAAAVGFFLLSACHPGPRIKANVLYKVYQQFATKEDLPIFSMHVFGKTMAVCGIEKKRFANGWNYLDIALREDLSIAAGEAA